MTIQQTCLSFDFCLDRNVPPVDDVTSLTAIGGNAYQGAAFTTTRGVWFWRRKVRRQQQRRRSKNFVERVGDQSMVS